VTNYCIEGPRELIDGIFSLEATEISAVGSCQPLAWEHDSKDEGEAAIYQDFVTREGEREMCRNLD
jgi:hypothetical protein